MRFLFNLTICLFWCFNIFAADYYVATDGSGDFTTIAEVNAQTFSAGDNIYFNRGDTWREQLLPDSGSTAGYITYSAYGNGNKPLLLGSTEENETSDWTDEGSNIWSNNDASFTVDVGNIIFNGGEQCGIKLQAEEDVDSDLEFWYDHTNDLIKIYSTSNPASRFTDIECALLRDIIDNLFDYVILENLDIRYGARHGIGIGGNDNIRIRDCDLSYIGGGDHYGNYTSRIGNAIEFWENTDNVVVERCRIDNIYDAALTNQGLATNTQNNITYRNNIITNSEYSFEYWNRPATSTTSNINFINNTCINAGSGWGHNQRWDAVSGRHLMLFFSEAATSNFNIKNNIFYESTESSISFNNAVNFTDFIIDYNCYYESSGDVCFVDNPNPDTTYDYATEWEAYQSATGQDANSIADNPLFNPGAYSLQADSPCVDAGVTLGDVTMDYRRLIRPTGDGWDIGAYELGNVVHIDGLTLNGLSVD
jgi:hypothetical protein